MKTKELLIDYGDKKIRIDIPAQTLVPRIPDPPALKDAEREIQKAVNNPMGSEPLPELAERIKKDEHVVIAFDDPPKPAIPRRIILGKLLNILNKVGVKDENIYLLSGNGTHCKWTDNSFRDYLGDDIYNRFRPLAGASRILNHDCHDHEHLVNMGVSKLGGFIEYNSLLQEAALFIYSGTVIPFNWGGMSGTGVVIGLASARSMLSTHGFPVIGHEESCHGDQRRSLYRKHKQTIMKHIEEFTGKRVFYVDFVPDKTGNISGIFAGYSPEINEPTWKFTESLYTIEVPQADILVVGIPKYLLYGKANNPLISLAGICAAPRFGVNKPLLREGGVIIVMTCCNGEIDDRAHCSYREVIGLFRRCHLSYELQQYEEEFLNREDLIFKYRFCHSVAPIHPFWLFYESQYALDRASMVIFAGVPTAGNKFSTLEKEGEGGPGATRDVGCIPATSFEDAMKLAEKVVGKSPTIVAFPEFWSQTRPYVYVK
jgi:nickel-dependent lactate racemase